MKRILLFLGMLLAVGYGGELYGQSCPPGSTPGGLTVTLGGSTSGNPLGEPTISGTATVCFSQTQPVITFTGSGGSAPYTFTYSINGVAQTPISTTGSNTTVTLSHPTDVAGTFVYTLISVADNTAAPGCSKNAGATNNEVTVIVHGQLTEGAPSANQTICFGETPTILSAAAPSGGSGTFIYQWQVLVGATWTDIGSATSLTYQPGALTETTQYRLVQTDTYCNPDQVVETTPITITVYDLLVAGTASADQEICYNTAPASISATAPTGGSPSTNFTYQWQFATTLAAGGNWANVAYDGNALTYAPGALTQTTYYRLLQTDTYCNPDQQVITNTVTITVYGQLTAGTATANQTICYNTAPTALSATTPTGGSPSTNFTYQWQFATTLAAGGNWANVASDGNALTYSPGALTQTTYFRLLQTDTYCSPDDQQVITNTITITVYDEFLAGTPSGPQSICYNTAPTQLSAAAPTGGNGSYTYQWQIWDGDSWEPISGQTGLTYTLGDLTATTRYRLAQTSGADCGTVYTNEIVVTVNAQLVATTCIVNDPCQNGEGVITVEVSGGTPNYTVEMSGRFDINTDKGNAGTNALHPNTTRTDNTSPFTFTGLFGNATYKILVTDSFVKTDASVGCTLGELH